MTLKIIDAFKMKPAPMFEGAITSIDPKHILATIGHTLCFELYKEKVANEFHSRALSFKASSLNNICRMVGAQSSSTVDQFDEIIQDIARLSMAMVVHLTKYRTANEAIYNLRLKEVHIPAFLIPVIRLMNTGFFTMVIPNTESTINVEKVEDTRVVGGNIGKDKITKEEGIVACMSRLSIICNELDILDIRRVDMGNLYEESEQFLDLNVEEAVISEGKLSKIRFQYKDTENKEEIDTISLCLQSVKWDKEYDELFRFRVCTLSRQVIVDNISRKDIELSSQGGAAGRVQIEDKYQKSENSLKNPKVKRELQSAKVINRNEKGVTNTFYDEGGGRN
uniref:Uncharacterized protein n=1 Tax=Tetraselmis chuii TaxID=63592 RepID=A0A7S1X9H5_9CHLO|mmetsp:Transcript_6541/g.11799  ORF Transcript_6541/g.11799 Transcript_6541/m.11799 type:complete len:337 (+) Transcript_6541:1596-2606(+)|eukprot:CAMPEP_0177750798 /NCGR_PEP_ID=MMETSP0491_2-20121128/32_1 /TAXON_ID=63592 /ORGANISM="Tetraselmis chuii, Strain PLY429" /LENGTH=336 /DNA_ID=CAMNT_0019265867 /DNA_START=2058 /DNA_END=3068 /DNA_ORIENTATION=+